MQIHSNWLFCLFPLVKHLVNCHCYLVEWRSNISSELSNVNHSILELVIAGRACISVHIFIARPQNRSRALAIYAAGSAMLVITMRSVPTVVYIYISVRLRRDPRLEPLWQ
jgi:hypothetical protein